MTDILTDRICAVLDDAVLRSVIDMAITNHSTAWDDSADEAFLARMNARAEEMATVATEDSKLALS